MSIAPPSDIILDVAQAADPQRLQAATSKLAKLASGSATVPDDFETLLTQAGGLPASTTATPVLRNSTLATTPATVVTTPASPYRKFEAVLLQSFVQEMLPKDEQLFGDAASADISRSMMAQVRQERHRAHERKGACPAPDRLVDDGLRRPGFCRRRRGTGPEDRVAVSSPDPARRCTLSGG